MRSKIHTFTGGEENDFIERLSLKSGGQGKGEHVVMGMSWGILAKYRLGGHGIRVGFDVCPVQVIPNIETLDQIHGVSGAIRPGLNVLV